MNRYIKISAALAAFALLLVVMGLSTQGSVNAQTAPGTITVPNKYLCSLDTCTVNSSGPITVQDGSGSLEVLNLDVARVTIGTAPSNPRTINVGDTITVVQEFTSPNVDGTPTVAGQIRAFNGNRVQIKYTPTSGFATTATILVDNVKPTLVTNSPDIPLVVKGNVNIVFSADLTDGGASYTSSVGTSGTSDIDDLNGTAGLLVATTNDSTDVGGVRLVVAGNVVNLTKSNFSAIDGGWQVSAELGSSAIQNIGANVPWYFETRDRAGNTRRSSGSISLKGAVSTGASGTGGITDGRFAGITTDGTTVGLPAASFVDTKVKVTRGSASKTVDVDTFNVATGAFALEFDADNFFTENGDVTEVMAGDKFELVGSNLLTIDSEAPRLKSPNATTGIVYSSSKKMAVRGLSAKANSIQVNFADDGKTDNDDAGSGLDAATVTPGAFTVSGNSVRSVLVKGNDVYLTLAENLAPDEQPSITIASGQIADKAGNAFGGQRISKAADGLGPNLSLAESGDLSDEKVTITITTDEQLGSLPTVRLGRVINSDGDVVNEGAVECVYAAVDAGSDPATEPALPAVTQATEDDGTTCEAPNDDGGLDARYQTTSPSGVAGRPAGAPNPSQTAALSYTYAVTAATANPIDEIGGKYNVYVEGRDTQTQENKGSVGHGSDANHSAAFTFQLDTALNDGGDPAVSVADETATASSGDAPDVEAVDPMIVTVDWSDESGEYDGDSYRTVTLTSAVLKVSFSDGSSETTTFDLTTEVSSADWIKYTIPILNPKVGEYTLTVKGEDTAGNASGDAGHSASWNVIAAKPVNIGLEPGWNLVSLPFQPGNPAINSVIGASHPADIVMTYDNATRVWLVSRRDAETGLFVGDIPVMTANTAYFIRTDKFQALKLLRPPLATAAAAPPPPPAISVVEGWNLVPVVSNDIPTPKTIDADDYFGTLGDKGWLKALTFNTLVRTWESVTPGETVTVTDADGDDTEVPATVTVGKGYWLYATSDGVIIP